MDHRNRAAFAALALSDEPTEKDDLTESLRWLLSVASDKRAAVAIMADVCFTESREAWAAWARGAAHQSARAAVNDPATAGRVAAQAILSGSEPDWSAIGGMLWCFYPTGTIETELEHYRRYEVEG